MWCARCAELAVRKAGKGDRETSRYLHADFVRALVQLPDGALLSGSYDGTLRRYAPDVRVPTTSCTRR